MTNQKIQTRHLWHANLLQARPIRHLELLVNVTAIPLKQFYKRLYPKILCYGQEGFQEVFLWIVQDDLNPLISP